MPAFRNEILEGLGDGSVVPWEGGEMVVSTDSFVVAPLEFPGGNIGDLAVNGTINDLAMMGAEPHVPYRRVHPRRGSPLRAAGPGPGVHGPGGPGGRGLGSGRRHEGGGAGEGRRALHQHDGDRPGPT